MEDPEGEVPKHAAAAPRAAARGARYAAASAAAGWLVPRVHLGEGGAPCAMHACAGRYCEAHRHPQQFTKRKGWEVRNLVTFKPRERTIGTQTVNRCNAVFRTDSRPVARDGSDRAVESGRPPTGGPVRSDRKEHRSSRVTTVRRTYVPLREERSRSTCSD